MKVIERKGHFFVGNFKVFFKETSKWDVWEDDGHKTYYEEETVQFSFHDCKALYSTYSIEDGHSIDYDHKGNKYLYYYFLENKVYEE